LAVNVNDKRIDQWNNKEAKDEQRTPRRNRCEIRSKLIRKEFVPFKCKTPRTESHKQLKSMETAESWSDDRSKRNFRNIQETQMTIDKINFDAVIKIQKKTIGSYSEIKKQNNRFSNYGSRCWCCPGCWSFRFGSIFQGQSLY
jgi:hypothetical protein